VFRFETFWKREINNTWNIPTKLFFSRQRTWDRANMAIQLFQI